MHQAASAPAEAETELQEQLLAAQAALSTAEAQTEALARERATAQDNLAALQRQLSLLHEASRAPIPSLLPAFSAMGTSQKLRRKHAAPDICTGALYHSHRACVPMRPEWGAQELGEAKGQLEKADRGLEVERSAHNSTREALASAKADLNVAEAACTTALTECKQARHHSGLRICLHAARS